MWLTYSDCQMLLNMWRLQCLRALIRATCNALCALCVCGRLQLSSREEIMFILLLMVTGMLKYMNGH